MIRPSAGLACHGPSVPRDSDSVMPLPGPDSEWPNESKGPDGQPGGPPRRKCHRDRVTPGREPESAARPPRYSVAVTATEREHCRSLRAVALELEAQRPGLSSSHWPCHGLSSHGTIPPGWPGASARALWRHRHPLAASHRSSEVLLLLVDMSQPAALAARRCGGAAALAACRCRV